MPWYAEEIGVTGRWGPVRYDAKPEVKDGRRRINGGVGPMIRGVKEIHPGMRWTGLAGLAALYGTHDRAIWARLLTYYSEEEAAAWLEAAHPQLGNHSAAHMIHQGEADAVHAVLDRLDADGYV